jgi:hypothetical protein
LPNRQLRRQLAGFLLGLREGDRLPSTRDLASFYGTSLGSVSNALKRLQASGAVRVSSRGSHGSFVQERSVGLLWEAAASSPMVIGLTLASNSHNEGLATALKQVLRTAGIQMYCAFIRGSRNRLEVLRQGRCHAVVMSCLAADELTSPAEKVVLRMPPGSFATGNSIFYSRIHRAPGAPLRLAVDRDSYDQTRLTALEFEGKEFVLQPTILPQMLRLLAIGRLDAAVLTSDDMQAYLSDTIAEELLSPATQAYLRQRDTSAAIVIRAAATDVEASLEAALNLDGLVEIQRAVVDGRQIAEY